MMMQRHNGSQNSLPPFIHPHLASSDFGIDMGENADPMEPLHNCISLVHMLGGGVRGSRKLFWKNVRLECERFCKEVCLGLAGSGKDGN
jgi:hypothetical protein